MQNTIKGNLKSWDEEHHWSRDGDEWDGQAKFCGVPYDEWKHSLIQTFLMPQLGPGVDVLEIAPGHGRWTEHIVNNCRSLTLIDLSPSCIEYCKKRFHDQQNVSYFTTDGSSLPNVADESVHFIWSFDSFVHMGPDTILAYLQEAARVLRPHGLLIIHHAGRRNSTLALGFMKKWGGWGRNVYKLISMSDFGDDDGWRSDVSPELILRLAGDAGLSVENQVQSWGKAGQYGVRRYGDWITILKK